MQEKLLLRIASCGLVLTVAGLVGCQGQSGGGGDQEPPEPATFRVANAELDGLAFDVCADGAVVLENSRFGNFTVYAEVDPGTVQLNRAVAGSDCDDFINEFFGPGGEVRLDEGTENTLVLLADGDSGFQLEDDNSPTSAGRARVRLINASEDSLSLTVREQGGTILFTLVRYDEPSDYEYIEVVAETYDLTVTPQAGEMTPFEFEGIEFGAGNVHTLFAVGRVDGEGEAFDLVVEVDATPGEEE